MDSGTTRKVGYICPLFWSAPTVCTPQRPLIFLTCPMSTAKTHKHVTHELICAWKFAVPSVEMTTYASFPEKHATNETDMIWLWYDMIWKKERTNESMNQWMNQWMTDHHLLYTKTNLPCSFFFQEKTRCHETWRNLLSPISWDPKLVGLLIHHSRVFFRRYCEANGIQITAYGSIFGGHQMMLVLPGWESCEFFLEQKCGTNKCQENSTSKKR